MNQLTTQLLLGLLMIGLTSAVQAFCIGFGIYMRPIIAKRIAKANLIWMIVLVSVSSMWMLFGMTLGVFMWAWTLIYLEAFDHYEPSIYFSLTSYTTLGFGDILPPAEWRVLGSMIGANGMLAFGLATAALVDFMHGMRRFPKD